MAAFLEGATDLDKLHNLCKKTHKEQAVWVRKKSERKRRENVGVFETFFFDSF